jgi:hypothetical protein
MLLLLKLHLSKVNGFFACLLLQINGLHRVPVKALVYLHNKAVVPQLPSVWSDSPAAKFNVYEVISAAAHRMRGLSCQPRDNITAVAEAVTDLASSSKLASQQPNTAN